MGKPSRKKERKAKAKGESLVSKNTDKKMTMDQFDNLLASMNDNLQKVRSQYTSQAQALADEGTQEAQEIEPEETPEEEPDLDVLAKKEQSSGQGEIVEESPDDANDEGSNGETSDDETMDSECKHPEKLDKVLRNTTIQSVCNVCAAITKVVQKNQSLQTNGTVNDMFTCFMEYIPQPHAKEDPRWVPILKFLLDNADVIEGAVKQESVVGITKAIKPLLGDALEKFDFVFRALLRISTLSSNKAMKIFWLACKKLVAPIIASQLHDGMGADVMEKLMPFLEEHKDEILKFHPDGSIRSIDMVKMKKLAPKLLPKMPPKKWFQLSEYIQSSGGMKRLQDRLQTVSKSTNISVENVEQSQKVDMDFYKSPEAREALEQMREELKKESIAGLDMTPEDVMLLPEHHQEAMHDIATHGIENQNQTEEVMEKMAAYAKKHKLKQIVKEAKQKAQHAQGGGGGGK